ncbi:MAG: hypothetical protein WBG16_13605 [Bradyrhizobium sp.]
MIYTPRVGPERIAAHPLPWPTLTARRGRGYPSDGRPEAGCKASSHFDATNFAPVSCDVGEECRPICLPDGATMTYGFLNIDSTGITERANLGWGSHSDRASGMSANRLRTAVGWLPIPLMLIAAGWFALSHVREPAAAASPMHVAAITSAKLASVDSTVGLAKQPSFDPATSEAIVPEQPAPVDRLKISSQSWRRGGLGSNALVTMTVRNDNSYAVKDIDIACAFSRPDGSYPTERSRVIPDVVNMKSRKTFVRLHVGFVNVYAAKAKCAPVAANHI